MKSLYYTSFEGLLYPLKMIHLKLIGYPQKYLRGALLRGIIILIGLDVFTTSIALDNGIGYEANLFMVGLVNNVSPLSLLLFKLTYLIPLIIMMESCDKSIHNSGVYIYLSSFIILWVPVINNSLVLITQGQENLFTLLGLL